MFHPILFLEHTLSTVGPFFLLLGLLIFVHELGHFLVAKYFNVRVEVFSLGFGKKILKYRKGDTTYCLSIIPLGGYVKMYGDDPTADVPEPEKIYSFLHKPVGQRIWIVLAGPLMNFFFAIGLLFAVAMIGEELPSGEIGDVNPTTAAAQAGFQSGDKIVKVDGHSVTLWSEIHDKIEESTGQPLDFSVIRLSQAEPVHVTATPIATANESIFSTQPIVGHIDGLSNEAMAAVIGIQDPTGIAAAAGVKNLDRIVSINGEEVRYFRDLEGKLKAALRAGPTTILKVVSTLNEDDAKERQIILRNPNPQSDKSVFDVFGIESSELYLSKIKPNSPAAVAGFQAGDRLVALNKTPIHKWQDVIDQISAYQPNQPGFDFELQRDSRKLSLHVIPEMTTLTSPKGKEEKRYTIGVVPALLVTTTPLIFYRIGNPLRALKLGLQRSVELSQMVVMSLVRLVQNRVSARNIGGVISIGRFASQSFAMGLIAFLKMMALISINLFLLNLLPVPVLDGGHLLFFSIEAVKGKPLGLKKIEIAQQIGLVLLMSLMAFAIFNDISNLIHPPW